MTKKKVLIAFGTRPEAIKLAPVIKELDKSDSFDTRVLHSGQHTDLVEPILGLFEITPDIRLNVMKDGQDLFDLMEALSPGLKKVFTDEQPDYVIVQGDTATAYLTALASYYLKIPVLHVEAGLRSHQPYNPFPEEMNRKLISQLCTTHFAPTSLNKENLLKEGIPEESVFITGNTVIDALHLIRKSPAYHEAKPSILSEIKPGLPLIVLTAHRRENHGQPLVNIFKAAEELLNRFENLQVLFPMHPNPEVEKALSQAELNHERFFRTSPVDYLSFLHVLDQAELILTDSGGIQEEAAALGKPVLVLREETERQELIDAGLGILTGADTDKIVQEASKFIAQEKKMLNASDAFGDGNSAKKIREIIETQL